ncbi:hypothetical protein HK405_003604 [Cladochytrium tenue]|nr:hypothetical protein HK405_003604 [Cladochytrium tenue]
MVTTADTVFALFFLSHIPVTLLIGTQSLLPASFFPAGLRGGVAWWAQASGDPWLSAIAAGRSLPAWWVGVTFVEVAFQLPWFVWYVVRHFSGSSASSSSASPAARAAVIVYCVECMTSLVPILAELVIGQPQLTDFQRVTVIGAYLPFFVAPAILLARTLATLSASLASPAQKAKKKA